MGSAAQRRGAYGEEYVRAGLRLRARGGRRKARKTSQIRAKDYKKKGWRLNNFSQKLSCLAPP
jgi:hypothetical protein